MLDGDKRTVYEALRQLTGEDDTFKVIEADEVLEKLPADVRLTKQQLSSIIKDLRDRDYIKVKYFTPDEYCLLTMKHTEELAMLVEEVTAVAAVEKTEQQQRAAAPQPVFKKWKLFATAFIGAFFGGAAVTAIALVLQIFLI